VNWILQTAKNKRKKYLMKRQKRYCQKRPERALILIRKPAGTFEISAGKSEVHKIDSLYKYYKKFY
jgi:hypothetical protein